MMFGHELIESLHFIAPHRPCVQMDENLLFIGCGLAKGGDFFLFHVRQHKKLRPACPAKSFNAFPFSGFPLPKNAPYARFGRGKDRISVHEPPPSETPSTKPQAPEKFQISSSKPQKRMPGQTTRRSVSDHGAWCFVGACSLEFGAFCLRSQLLKN